MIITEEMLKEMLTKAAEEEIAEIESMKIDEKLSDNAKRKINCFHKKYLDREDVPYPEM